MSKQMIKTISDPRPIIQFTCDYCFSNDTLKAFDDSIYDITDTLMEFEECGWISREIDNQKYDFCSEQCYYDYIKENK